jgi:dihydrofolate reductase
MPVLSLIVAAAENDVIGRDNALPWHLPDDLKHFKALTMGKPMLMGRKTFESIGKPLPGRTSIVLTRSKEWQREGVIVVQSVDEALTRAGNAPELTVIGGTEVFRATLPRADRIYLTRVHAEVAGDAVMPKIDPKAWREVARVHHPADERHEYPMTFLTLERV